MLDATDFSIQKGLKRMFLITKDMHQHAISLLTTGAMKTTEEIISRDDDVDKLIWMISTQYNMILQDVFYAEKLKTDRKRVV